MNTSVHYLDDPDRRRRSLVNNPGITVDAPRMMVQEDQESGKLLDYYHIFLRRKFVVFIICLLGIIIALVVSSTQQRVFRARAALEIQDNNENFLNKGFDNTQAQSDSAETLFQTQIRLLQSETLLQRVIRKLNLHESAAPGEMAKRLAVVRSWFGLSSLPPVPEESRVLQNVTNNLTVRVSGQTRIVEVLYDSPNPQLAADFPNTLADEFIQQTQELHWQSTQRTGTWLTGQLADMKVKLEQSEAQLHSMAGASGLMLSDGKDTIDEMKLRRLEEELSKAQADRVDTQSKLEMARSAAADTLPEILNDPTLRDYNIKLTELQREETELSTTLTPAHYKVQQVEQQIQQLRATISRQRADILKRIENDFDTSRRREALVIEESLRQGKIVADQSNKAVNYNMLKHEVDTSRQLYELLLQRVKEAGVAAAIQASNIIVVDPARRPLRPYKPNMVMNSAIGLLSGLFLSFGTVFIMELSDRRLLNPGDAQVHLNLPELGLIPQANIRYPRRAIRSGGSVSLNVNGTEEVLEGQAGECLELVTWNRKPSPIAESFRAVLPSILLGGHSGQRPRIIVMTSPSPGEGKTTVASNLAISIAEITKNTLLIDGDMRRPRLHDVFGVRRDPGLGDLLGSTGPLDWRAVNANIRSTMVAGLSVLPSGTAAETLSNLFYSRRLPELLMLLRQNFDTVIIDAPPILNIPDARLLGRLADGVIMVVRAGQTQRQSALAANQYLADDGTLVLGTIFNSWDPKSATAYTYGYTRAE